MAQLHKPGTDNLPAGEYIETDSSGQEIKNARQVTIESGDRLPPTQKSGNMWRKV